LNRPFGSKLSFTRKARAASAGDYYQLDERIPSHEREAG